MATRDHRLPQNTSSLLLSISASSSSFPFQLKYKHPAQTRYSDWTGNGGPSATCESPVGPRLLLFSYFLHSKCHFQATTPPGGHFHQGPWLSYCSWIRPLSYNRCVLPLPSLARSQCYHKLQKSHDCWLCGTLASASVTESMGAGWLREKQVLSHAEERAMEAEYSVHVTDVY